MTFRPHIRAGRLDKRVTVQTRTLSQDSAGGPVETWADTLEIYARVEPKSGRESVKGLQFHSDTTHLVEIRFFAGLSTTANRIKYGERVLNIVAIHDVREQGALMLVECGEDHDES